MYTRQTNIVDNNNTRPCDLKQSALQFYSPSYELGPLPYVQCPYYNYILPNTYPIPSCSTPVPSLRQYWYYPYYQNDKFWTSVIPCNLGQCENSHSDMDKL
jgi:hypothetical protein